MGPETLLIETTCHSATGLSMLNITAYASPGLRNDRVFDSLSQMNNLPAILLAVSREKPALSLRETIHALKGRGSLLRPDRSLSIASAHQNRRTSEFLKGSTFRNPFGRELGKLWAGPQFCRTSRIPIEAALQLGQRVVAN
jgi:hypothetical protein